MPGRLAAAALVLGLLGTALRAAAPAQAADPVGDLLAKLDAYFETYHEALGQLVAEERLVQTTGGSNWNSIPDSSRAARNQPIKITREIHSEVAFVDLPGDAGWLGFRDVLRVGNREVRRPGPSLSETLLRGGADGYESARSLLLASAAHNLGEPRTTNLPNLPLELLHARNRWRYDSYIEGTADVRGHATTIAVLEEKSTPTIIQRPEGGDIVARVKAWIEAGTGRLWRAEVRLTDSRLIFAQRHLPVDMRVDFKEHPALGLLVPDRMTESFYAASRGVGRGEARYSNFRRFTTGARIVPQR